MPLYEYECTVCGRRTEIIQKFSDAPLSECPSCGKEVERLLSAPAIQFKGQGWYVTDYASKAKAKASQEAKESSSSSDSKSKSGKESKDSKGSKKSA